ncbi:MAG: restriction endonuclease [Bacilli bacterium]|nr:restriction endonuclease [Bacilli bacterium]
MNKKEKSLLLKETSKKLLLDELKDKQSVYKKDILKALAKPLKDALKEKGLNIQEDDASSYLGSCIAEAVKQKTLVLKNGLISLKKAEELVKVSKEECKTVVLDELQKKALTRNELFKKCIEDLGANKTQSKKDDGQIKSYVGMILEELTKDNVISFSDSKYSIESTSKYSKKPLEEKEFKKQFFQRLHDNGGLFFEKFLSNLLEKYYSMTGRTVIENEVIGGANDGGVDVKLTVEEDLGFKETIFVQAKCRMNTQVTEKEIREFYGSVNALKGSRGLFVTTSTFHDGALKLLKSIDNCTGIDGDKLFELAKLSAYGIHESKLGFKFDDLVFDI